MLVACFYRAGNCFGYDFNFLKKKPQMLYSLTHHHESNLYWIS